MVVHSPDLTARTGYTWFNPPPPPPSHADRAPPRCPCRWTHASCNVRTSADEGRTPDYCTAGTGRLHGHLHVDHSHRTAHQVDTESISVFLCCFFLKGQLNVSMLMYCLVFKSRGCPRGRPMSHLRISIFIRNHVL